MSPFLHSKVLVCLAAAAAFVGVAPAQGSDDPGYRAVGDAIPAPLATAGDVSRGRQLVLDRNGGACVLCHALPEPSARFMGTVGPALGGVGSRYSAAQLRLRVVDMSPLKADAVMPSYYRTWGLNQVAAAYRGRTILTAQQVEDVVAYLETLR